MNGTTFLLLPNQVHLEVITETGSVTSGRLGGQMNEKENWLSIG